MSESPICFDGIPRIDLLINVTPSDGLELKFDKNKFDLATEKSTVILVDGISRGFQPLHSQHPDFLSVSSHLVSISRFELSKQKEGTYFPNHEYSDMLGGTVSGANPISQMMENVRPRKMPKLDSLSKSSSTYFG